MHWGSSKLKGEENSSEMTNIFLKGKKRGGELSSLTIKQAN